MSSVQHPPEQSGENPLLLPLEMLCGSSGAEDKTEEQKVQPSIFIGYNDRSQQTEIEKTEHLRLN